MDTGSSLYKRYAGAVSFGTELNETCETIIGHRSCRSYLDREVPREMLDLLVAAAQSAPSSCNMQSWSVVAITDPAVKSRIGSISGQGHVEHAPLLLCFLADLARLQQVAVDNGISHDALDYLEMLLVAVIDASLAAQNLATAAASLGLGTCYIGSIRNELPEMCDLLGLPDKVAPLFALTVGYPDPASPAEIKPRLAPSSVLHMERYDKSAATAPVPDYEQALEAFNQSQGRKMPLWGVRSALRVSSIERMEGRHILWEQLKAQGFALK
jgi:nitroreductase